MTALALTALGLGRLLGTVRQVGRHDREAGVPPTVLVGNVLTGDLQDVLEQVALVVGAEGHGRAAGTGPGRPPDPVNVGLRHVGQFVLDHVADRVDVDAPGGDVCGDHGPDLTRLEGRQGALALALALVAMDRRGLDS